jgi:hypothetical protein
MAVLARDFWSGIWSRSPREPGAIRGFLKDHTRKINPALSPQRLGHNHFIPLINNTGDSCAGTDGVPFAVYRAAVDVYAGIAAGLFNALADGVPPPDGFNDGILFLLPKKGSGLASDTRPISVTNAFNRILAHGVLKCITEALQDFLHPSQKGFIPGRDGADHIRRLNELFYSSVEDMREEFFSLFVDTEKAFDSIDHEFLFAVLGKIGLPSWVITLIKALLSGARVNPVLGGGTSIWIAICRGVKQGCPLSPLLFALVYDPLLVRLAQIKGLFTFAFADDMALGSSSFSPIKLAMVQIDLFRRASGLGVNISKTTLVSARGSREAVSSLVQTSVWPTLTIADSHVYLGILMGRDISVQDIYAKALEGLEARATAYYPVVRRLHHASRVTVFNVFVFSKLSYLMNFYSIPYGNSSSVVATVERIASRMIVNFNHAYPYFHLIQPTSRFGPSPPVRDPWAVSIATLAAQADILRWDGAVSTHTHRPPGEQGQPQDLQPRRRQFCRLPPLPPPWVSGVGGGSGL